MKLSIIVPVYNVENYIARCLESIIRDNTRVKDYEIVIVNDNTQDKSMAIVHKFILEASNVKFTIINNELNLGLGASRNIGIKNATGDYLMFLDSDDWLEPRSIEKIMVEINQGFELILLNVQDVFQDKTIKSSFNSVNFKEELLTSFSPTAWSKVYHREFFKNIQFPEKIYHEDLAIWPLIVLKTQQMSKITHITDIIVNYECRNQNSITRQFNQKVVDDYQKVFEFQDQQLIAQNTDLDTWAAVSILQFKNYEYIETRLKWVFKMSDTEVAKSLTQVSQFLKNKNPTMYLYLENEKKMKRRLRKVKYFLPSSITDKIKSFIQK